MHYMTRKSHRMQKHMFDVTCPGALFLQTVLSHTSTKNSASTFHASDAPECTA
jgi:ribosomal protein S27E